MSRSALPVLLVIAALAAFSVCGQTCVYFVSPLPQFTAYVGQAVPLQVQAGACGSVGSVVVMPDSETNVKIGLTNQGNGLWVGSWKPAINASSVLLERLRLRPRRAHHQCRQPAHSQYGER
jgi:hypothetical protein